MHSQGFNTIIRQLAHMKSFAEVKHFLTALLTPQELSTISQRIEIIKMLKKGIPQRIIASKLQVGIATVTRGSKELSLTHFKNV